MREVAEDDDTEVVNETKNSRLVVARDGYEGELIYERRGNQLILVHTGVSEKLRGKGVGVSWSKLPSCEPSETV